MKHELGNGWQRRAFTLVELLVVISIIGALAGLTLAVLPGIMRKRNVSRLTSEHAAVLTAIENYKSGQGFYPPGNANSISNSTLLYELKGVVVQNSSGERFVYENDSPGLTSAQLKMNYGVDGIANAAAPVEGESRRATDYFPSMSTKMVDDFGKTGENVPLRRLVSGVLGGDGQNLVFYYDVTSSGRHNPESFDLWAEYVSKGKTILIKNW